MTTKIQSNSYPLTEQIDLKVKRQLWSLLAVILLHILVLLLFRYFIKSEILKLSLEDTVLPIELEIVPSYYAEVNPEAVEKYAPAVWFDILSSVSNDSVSQLIAKTKEKAIKILFNVFNINGY